MGFSIKINQLLSGALYWVLIGLFAPVFAAGCQVETVQLRGDWGQALFNVEVADDPELRASGLMNREEMGRTAGMLFIYPKPQPVAFWMRNTLIPLDMLFVGPLGLVLAIHENAIPLDETPIPGGQGVQYVLEINGGMVSSLGISVGSQLQHPSIDQKNAVWACEVQ